MRKINFRPIWPIFGIMIALSTTAFEKIAVAQLETLTPSSRGRSGLNLEEAPATAMEIVKRGWETADSFDEKSIRGLYEGRCYFRDRPNDPVASLLVVSGQNKSAHGDLKGLSERKSILQIIDRDGPPDRFAKVSPSTRKRIENLAQRERRQSSFAYQVRGRSGGDDGSTAGLWVGTNTSGLITDFFRTDDRGAFQLNLRRDKDRIFSQTICTENSYCLNTHGRIGINFIVAQEGESTTSCYYFRRLPKPPSSDRSSRFPDKTPQTKHRG